MKIKGIIARIKKKRKKFEILVSSENIQLFKQGKIRVENIVMCNTVFSDIKKGIRASEKEMKNIFGTYDFFKIAAVIVNYGVIQITTDQIRQELEQKRRRIVDIIRQNAINPLTNKPYPFYLIDDALKQTKFRVDGKKPAEVQVNEAIKEIKRIIPISCCETRELLFKIPIQYAGKALGILKQKTRVITQKYEGYGNLSAIVEIPAGIQEDLEMAINAITKKSVSITMLNKN